MQQIVGNHPTYEYLIGPSISEFKGNTVKSIDVLKRYFDFDRRSTENDKISYILNEIKNIYDVAGISITSTEHIRIKLKKLIKNAKLIISKRKSNSPGQIKKENEFFVKINAPFDIIKTIESNELGSSQPIASCSYHTITSNNNSELAEYNCNENNSSDSEYEMSSDAESTEDELSDPRKKYQISKEIMEKIHSSANFHTSYEDMSKYIKIGIEIAGGNPENYSVSKSQLFKQISELRNNKRHETLTKLSDGDSKLLIHFDTKSCRKLNKRHLGHQNRLVVIFQSENSATTVGPFKLDNHEANTIAETIKDLIEEHNLENRVVALSSDTESTNTGRHNGVCLQLEQFLKKDLLYCMCRHHVYELILKHVGDYIFGATSGPNFNYDSMGLKREWETLNYADFTSYDGENMNQHFNEFRENSIEILREQMDSKITRDDYAELTDLALKFFDASDTQKKGFMAPSGMSNARWMQKAIYSLKTYLFRDQIQLTDRAKQRLQRFSMFISAIYVKHWNRTTKLFEAAINDLELLKELERYRTVDEGVANTALKVLKRHLYYLSDELVVVSIYSKHLSNENKEIIRAKLGRDFGPRTNNSIRYISNDTDFSTMQIHDFITNRSTYLFSLLELDISFLNHNVDTWDELQSFQETRKKLKMLLPVVNDHAERTLGQTSNAINNQKARKEHTLQNLLSSKFNK